MAVYNGRFIGPQTYVNPDNGNRFTISYVTNDYRPTIGCDVYGEYYKFEATAAAGYRFKEWIIENGYTSEDNDDCCVGLLNGTYTNNPLIICSNDGDVIYRGNDGDPCSDSNCNIFCNLKITCVFEELGQQPPEYGCGNERPVYFVVKERVVDEENAIDEYQYFMISKMVDEPDNPMNYNDPNGNNLYYVNRSGNQLLLGDDVRVNFFDITTLCDGIVRPIGEENDRNDVELIQHFEGEEENNDDELNVVDDDPLYKYCSKCIDCCDLLSEFEFDDETLTTLMYMYFRFVDLGWNRITNINGDITSYFRYSFNGHFNGFRVWSFNNQSFVDINDTNIQFGNLFKKYLEHIDCNYHVENSECEKNLPLIIEILVDYNTPSGGDEGEEDTGGNDTEIGAGEAGGGVIV